MDRTQQAIRNHYYKGLMDFSHEGLAPPPAVVANGDLPTVEAVSQLMTLHQDCLQRVRKKVPAFDAKLENLGPDEVVTPLLNELADFFDLPVNEILEGFTLRDNRDALYDRLSQPRLEAGELDMSVLGPECSTELDRNGWGDMLCTVEAYATPYDPRLPLVRSWIGLRSEGIAWVSCPRPQNFQVALFDNLRLIHHQSDQWCLEFKDWRRRRIADRQNSDAWEEFLVRLRELSGHAGFEWSVPTEGHRNVPYDAVIYNVAGWTTEQQAMLTESLVAASIPHDWDGSDVRVPSEYEKRVDGIIDAS